MTTESEKKIPTVAEMVAHYKEQITLLEYQLKYAILRREIQEEETKRIEAVAKYAYFTNPPAAKSPVNQQEQEDASTTEESVS
jgi:hypothetical protein